MRLKHKLSLDDQKSAMQIAKENKEAVEKLGKKKKQKPLSKAKPGLENTCNWGEHNKNFNKYCL